MDEKAKSRKLPGLIRRRLIGFAEVFVLLAFLGILASLFGRFHFLLDLCTHFRPHAAIVFLISGAGIFFWGRRKWGVASLVLGSILMLTLSPYLIPRRAEAEGVETKRLLLMNVLTDNPRKEEMIKFLRDQSPDIFVLLETDSLWVDAVRIALEKDYPYYREMPRTDNFGICMMSRIPFSEARVVIWGEAHVPSIDARFDDGKGGAFRIIGTHPLPPVRSSTWKSRNIQLAAIAETVADDPGPTLVAGDLNSSPWSPYFNDFLESSGLRDSALGFGIWPTWIPGSLFAFALPLDHICVSEHVVVHARRVGPALGSDHRAVIVDFSIRDADQGSGH